MNCNEQGIMQNLGLTEKIFDSRKWGSEKMGDTCERTGYEAVQLSTENDTEYVSSGISDMAGAVAGIDWRTSVYCMDDSDWRL